jgi:serine-type D-Ala-D-Ala carboxypeptidase/endopeptidase (penicillin-binding protein 4)
MRVAVLLLVLHLLVLTPACARHGTPVTTPGAVVLSSPGEKLQAELDAIFLAPDFHRMLWGVVVQSLSSGEILYRLNPGTLLMPASNMKIVTVAAAAERLGWDYRYETRIVTQAPVVDGVLKGDLIVVGSGDPTLTPRNGDPSATLERWADQLRNAGIRVIEGNLIGDDNLFDDQGLGAGWSWDYLAYGYAAPVGALQFSEGIVRLQFRAGELPGDPVFIEIQPAPAGLSVENLLVTTTKGGTVSLNLQRLPGSSLLRLSGGVPAGTEPFVRTASVDNPTEHFLVSLQSVFEARGLEIRGAAIDVDLLPSPPDLTGAQILLTHRSEPLSTMAAILMKESQNLYSDTLLRTLGAQAGEGTAEAGRKVVGRLWQAGGFHPRRSSCPTVQGSRDTTISAPKRSWRYFGGCTFPGIPSRS